MQLKLFYLTLCYDVAGAPMLSAYGQKNLSRVKKLILNVLKLLQIETPSFYFGF